MPKIPEEATYENWYDNPRSPRNEKKKAKLPNQVSPEPESVAPAPTFEEGPMAEGEPEPRVPMVCQDEDDEVPRVSPDEDDDIMSHIPRGLGFPMRIQAKPPAPPRRSPRTSLPQFQRANAAIFANQKAIYEVLAHAMEAPKIFTPNCLKAAKLSALTRVTLTSKTSVGA